jgi:hypothetical protein
MRKISALVQKYFQDDLMAVQQQIHWKQIQLDSDVTIAANAFEAVRGELVALEDLEMKV